MYKKRFTFPRQPKGSLMYKSYFRMTFAISDIIILLYVDGYIKTIVVTIGNLIYAPMR